mmetsp:Transcript_28704/g.60072  ORF Transcript_28704/g.60072 Transcript_28704/m.60072 type:complete len:209 (-) Transcript_28704:71-697(-)
MECSATTSSAATRASPTSTSFTRLTPRLPASLVLPEPSAMATGSDPRSMALSGSQTRLPVIVSSLPARQVTSAFPLPPPVGLLHMPYSSAACVPPPPFVPAALIPGSRVHRGHLHLLAPVHLRVAVPLCFLPYPWCYRSCWTSLMQSDRLPSEMPLLMRVGQRLRALSSPKPRLLPLHRLAAAQQTRCRFSQRLRRRIRRRWLGSRRG